MNTCKRRDERDVTNPSCDFSIIRRVISRRATPHVTQNHAPSHPMSRRDVTRDPCVTCV
nr:MAG TPA: hypothetical protein [Caudoviricetes sp.]DAY03395.1 MAG TPA: hypothetical protein [Caudoviricetes sp.]